MLTRPQPLPHECSPNSEAVSRVVEDPRDIVEVVPAMRSDLPFHRSAIEVAAVAVAVVDKLVVGNDKVDRFVRTRLF